MSLQRGWVGRHDPECATITRHNGVGALQVSAARKDGPVSDDDLRDFAKDVPQEAVGVPVQHGAFTGLEYRFVREGQAWIQWFLRSDSTVVFVTYNCDASNRGLDDKDVLDMLASLKLRQG
ncbi:MAG: hypothetical protein FJX72_21150 [Armatimonadetes bacterium]|nr:hypothetical protein [Armatimonadota bacterium]